MKTRPPGGKAPPKDFDPSTPCAWCRECRWWISVRGALVCAVCHPPANEDLILKTMGSGWL